MPEVKDPSRVKELKSALAAQVAENDRIADTFKVEGDTVELSTEQATEFRKGVAKAKEIKALIDDLYVDAELKTWMEQPEGGSAAVAAAASAAAGSAAGAVRMLESKSLGQRFLESEEFKSLVSSGRLTMDTPWAVNDADMAGGWGQKDVYTALAPTATNLGFGRTQRDAMLPLRQRTARVRDLFPVTTTTANLIEFYKVSGFTNNAATVAERSGGTFAAKPQSSLTFSLTQAPVRTIAHYEVAHRNVLADEPQLRATIDNELMYGLRLAEDAQILSGDGTGENLLGILVTPGIQTHLQSSIAGDTKADAIRRSLTKVLLAYYESTGVVVHPYDWEDIELIKDDNGNYVVATNVVIGAESRIWRNPVVDTPAIAEGTWLAGAFGLGAQLYDREDANIRIAEQHADFFVRNAIAILAEERLALAVKRPESFVKGTFTA